MKKWFLGIARKARRVRLWRRVLSLFLSLVLMYLFVPAIVYAEAAEAISSIGADGVDENSGNNEGDNEDSLIYTYEGVALCFGVWTCKLMEAYLVYV